MKRSFSLPFTVAAIILAAALYEGAASRAQQKPATAQQKMASVDYLVGTWSCAHTVGTFSGKYTTAYSKVLGNLWLKQTYDFPSQQTAEGNEPAVTAERSWDTMRDAKAGCVFSPIAAANTSQSE
jgi:hypothetical protein